MIESTILEFLSNFYILCMRGAKAKFTFRAGAKYGSGLKAESRCGGPPFALRASGDKQKTDDR
jgi:hypothetical protein